MPYHVKFNQHISEGHKCDTDILGRYSDGKCGSYTLVDEPVSTACTKKQFITGTAVTQTLFYVWIEESGRYDYFMDDLSYGILRLSETDNFLYRLVTASERLYKDKPVNCSVGVCELRDGLVFMTKIYTVEKQVLPVGLWDYTFTHLLCDGKLEPDDELEKVVKECEEHDEQALDEETPPIAVTHYGVTAKFNKERAHDFDSYVGSQLRQQNIERYAELLATRRDD